MNCEAAIRKPSADHIGTLTGRALEVGRPLKTVPIEAWGWVFVLSD